MTLRVEVDWDKTGFSGSLDDVTGLVRRLRGISLEYGRDQSTALAPTVAGRGSFTLNNHDRRFSPRNPTSPLFGLVKPSRPVRVTRSVPVETTDVYSDSYSDFYSPGGDTYDDVYDDVYFSGDVSYTIFVGHTDDSPINPDLTSKDVTLSVVDSLADFRGQNVSTQLFTGVRTGTAIGHILDAAGWPADLRDLDAGATVIPWFWVDNKDALTALEEVLRSEGPPAMLTMGTTGEVIFRDRHHRLTNARSLTSQATWRSTGTVEPVMNRPGFTYDEAWRNIVNTGTVEVGVRQGAEATAVWTSDTTIALTGGEQRIITASTSDPFINIVAPVAGTDYTVLSGDVTVALLNTSGSSADIRLTAGGGGVVMQGLQLRATPVPVSHSVQVSASDVASIEDYGPRSYPGDLPWCNQYDAEAVLQTTIAQRANPNPILNVRFMIGIDAERCAAILDRDLSDRVTVIEPETALDDEFFVESIQHEATSEHDHSVTFGLEMVPLSSALNALVEFEFDDDDAGFDEGVFGSGLIPAEDMFTFDEDATGFDIGGFAL